MGRQTINDAMIFMAADLFLNSKLTTDEISKELNKTAIKMKQAGALDGKLPQLNRTNIYRLIRQARDCGFIKFVPPLESTMPVKLGRAFEYPSDCFTVVDTLGRAAHEYVSAQAAENVLELLKRIKKERRKDAVTMGLGPGRGTRDFCRHLGKLLESDSSDLKLRLVAISAGAPALQPDYASSSFYNLFPAGRVVERVGLFAETLVASSDFKKIQGRPGIAEAFREKESGNIDVVVNSMGDLADREDLLGAFLEQARLEQAKSKDYAINPVLQAFLEEKARLIDLGRSTNKMEVIANVQYRPFTKDGPIYEQNRELRACTLFELKDFVDMVKQDRHVILIARQCGVCGMTRARGLRPLLLRPDLKVWSHIVMDINTAREVLI